MDEIKTDVEAKESPVRRLLTEEEIKGYKKRDKLIVIAHYVLMMVVIMTLIITFSRVKSLDGARCVTNPCSYCMEIFEDIECKEAAFGIRTNELNLDSFNFSDERNRP